MKKKNEEQSLALALNLEKWVQPKKIIDHSKDFWMKRKLQTTDIRNLSTLLVIPQHYSPNKLMIAVYFKIFHNKHGFSRFKVLKN